MAVLKDLIVHGRSRFVNGAQFNTINAESIGATEGIFNKLIATTLEAKEATIDDLTATNATIVGLLDVQGEMHTKSWSNSNIATIDGNFYITPTVVSADGADVTASGYTPTGTLTYSNGNYTQMTIAGTFDTSQLTLDDVSSIDWPANSYVIITGEVSIGKEWYPLGTIRGKLGASIAKGSGAAAKSITIVPIGTQIISGEVGNISLTDGNGHKPSTLEAIRIAISETSGASLNSLKLRKIKISMTSRASGNDQYALGIYMTAMGSNKKTFLDIYGGSNKNGENVSQTINNITYQSGALAIPTVRIGNLLGLPMVGGVTPKGWGIYTNNGFFTGTIVARQGKIGSADQGAWTIGNDSNTGAAYIYTGTLGVSPSAYISTGYGTTSIADSGTLTNDKKWVFTAGDKFGVTNEGDLYASNATINGNIIAQSLTIQGTGESTYNGVAAINITGYTIEIEVVDIVNSTETKKLIPHLLHNGENVDSEVEDKTKFLWYTNGVMSVPGEPGDELDGSIIGTYGYSYKVIYDFEDGAVEGGTDTQVRYVDPSKYITQTEATGIQIHPETRTNVGYIQLNINGLENGVSLANYSNTIRIGPENSKHLIVSNSGIELFNNINSSLASFGDTIRVGEESAGHINITPSIMEILVDEDTSIASFGLNGIQIGTDNLTDKILIDTNGIHGISTDNAEFFNIDMNAGISHTNVTIGTLVKNESSGILYNTDFPIILDNSSSLSGETITASLSVRIVNYVPDWYLMADITSDGINRSSLYSGKYWTPTAEFTGGVSGTQLFKLGNLIDPIMALSLDYDGDHTIVVKIISYPIGFSNQYGDSSEDSISSSNITLSKASGSTINSDKLYFLLSNSRYQIVKNPVASSISNYYWGDMIQVCKCVECSLRATIVTSTKGSAFVFGSRNNVFGSRAPFSATIGQGLNASYDHQIAMGRFNACESDYLLMLGNGDSVNASNALTVDWNGNLTLAGSIKSNRNILSTAGTVSITATGQTLNFCSLTLPANSKFLILTTVITGKGNALTLINHITCTNSPTIMGANTRVTTSSGQGVANWYYVATNSSSSVATLHGYSYPDGGTGYNQQGYMLAIPL